MGDFFAKRKGKSFVLVSDGERGTLGEIISANLRECRFIEVGPVTRISYHDDRPFRGIGEYMCSIESAEEADGGHLITVNARSYHGSCEGRLSLFMDGSPRKGKTSYFPIGHPQGLLDG